MAALIRIGVKAGILGGALYVTHESGVWGNAEQSRAAYDRFLKSINELPGAKEYIPMLSSAITENIAAVENMIPDISKTTRSATDYWNCGVKYTFEGLASLPSNAQSGIKKGIDMAIEAINKTT